MFSGFSSRAWKSKFQKEIYFLPSWRHCWLVSFLVTVSSHFLDCEILIIWIIDTACVYLFRTKCTNFSAKSLQVYLVPSPFSVSSMLGVVRCQMRPISIIDVYTLGSGMTLADVRATKWRAKKNTISLVPDSDSLHQHLARTNSLAYLLKHCKLKKSPLPNQ